MRAIYSYGIALVIVLVLAVWLGTGILVNGGHGPGKGEKPVVSLIEKNGGPLTDTVEKSGINKAASALEEHTVSIATRRPLRNQRSSTAQSRQPPVGLTLNGFASDVNVPALAPPKNGGRR